jgi:hypothetical protein
LMCFFIIEDAAWNLPRLLVLVQMVARGPTDPTAGKWIVEERHQH